MFQQSRFSAGAGSRTPKRQWMWIASIIAILTVIFSYNVSAQVSTADILGTVQDQTGAVVRNATVKLLSSETNQERTTQTTEGGSYTFTLLPPGHYTVTITAHGFKEYVVDSTLAAGDRARIDAHLVVGETTEKVEVTSTTPALQTDSASLGAVVTPQAVQDLPLNGRNFVQLAQLAPGVNEGPPDSIASGQRPDDRRQTSSLSANGQPDLANNQMIDSVDNNDAIIGTIGARASIEAIAEFRVYTSLYPAELGKTGGAVVNLITKSGTTQFHGSLFEFLRNDIFDGNTYNFGGPAPVKPEYRQNQFGGSIGGPLFKRTFFFGDYEALRYVQGQPQNVTVPTLFEEQNPGNFSDVGGPVLTGTLDPVGLNYFNLFPAPTSTAINNNYYSAPNKAQYSNAFDVRVDHTTAKGDAIFGRETYNHVTTNTPSALPRVKVAGLEVDPGGNFNSYAGPALNIAHNAVLGYTHLFTPNLVGEFRAGYNRVYNESNIPNTGKDVSQAFGLDGVNVNSNLTGLTMLILSGYASLGDSFYLPIIETSNTLEYNGAITYSRGKHIFKAGATYIRRGGREQQNSYGLGFDIFIAAPTGNTLASLLSGAVLSVNRSNQVVVPNYRQTSIGEFAQDDWHVNKYLTLNLGVRYDIFTPQTFAE